MKRKGLRVMQPLDRSKNNKVHRYCCSNPNCKKVFSKPKIIKYYVCPTCQTLVDVTFEDFQLLSTEKSEFEKKQTVPIKQKEIKKSIKQELEAIFPTPSQQPKISNELTFLEKSEAKETIEEIKPAQMEEPKTMDITLNEKSKSTVKEQMSNASGDVQCSYDFGYLSQRDKGEGIPETCFGCPKSIECMLSEYNRSKDSVEEIKKWYPFKF